MQMDPPGTVKNLLAALFRVYKGNRGASVYSCINKVEFERHFPKVSGQTLRSCDIGGKAVIKPKMMRSLGILGMSTSQSLLKAVFFYNGKLFATGAC
jgi:hypothetical protein